FMLSWWKVQVMFTSGSCIRTGQRRVLFFDITNPLRGASVGFWEPETQHAVEKKESQQMLVLRPPAPAGFGPEIADQQFVVACPRTASAPQQALQAAPATRAAVMAA